jgi:hypothetical protein
MGLRLTVSLLHNVRFKKELLNAIPNSTLTIAKRKGFGEGSPLTLYSGTEEIGLIAPVDRQKVSALLDTSAKVDIVFQLLFEKEIVVEINLQKGVSLGHSIELIDISDQPGIYEIKFIGSSGLRSYIGQSTDIRKRIRAHQSDLIAGRHHNIAMQTAWGNRPESFTATTIFSTSSRLAGMALQKELYEKEHYYIGVRGFECVNKVDADLSITTTAKKDLKRVVERVQRNIRQVKEREMKIKVELGALIINLGLIETEVPKGIDEKVLPTNVLSWVEKRNKQHKYHSIWVPRVSYSPLFHAIFKPLCRVQERISSLDRDMKFCRDLIEYESTSVGRNGATIAAIKKLDELDKQYEEQMNLVLKAPIETVRVGKRVKFSSVICSELAPETIQEL